MPDQNDLPRFAVASGIEISFSAINALCDEGPKPALLIGYAPDLKFRSGFMSLRDIAHRHDIPLIECTDINDPSVQDSILAIRVDLLVVAGWSQLIREPLLSAFSLGAVGLHPTKLPVGRGRAPIPWSIIKGLTSSAVTLFYLNEAADAGDIIQQIEFPIGRRDTARVVYERAADAHAKILRECVPKLLLGTAERHAQTGPATTWIRRRPDDGIIDWQTPASDVYNWIRALSDPYPAAFTLTEGRRLMVYSADLLDVPGLAASDQTPGTVLGGLISTGKGGLAVQCSDGIVVLREVGWHDAESQNALELLETGVLTTGTVLGRAEVSI